MKIIVDVTGDPVFAKVSFSIVGRDRHDYLITMEQ